MTRKKKSKPNDDDVVIYRAWIRTKSGKVIWAWQYGLKAFPIRIRPPAA